MNRERRIALLGLLVPLAIVILWQIAALLQKTPLFPGPLKVKLFRVATGNGRTEWVVTNDLEQDSVDDTREICAVRWKIE